MLQLLQTEKLNDVKRPLTGHWLQKCQWSQERLWLRHWRLRTCVQWQTRSPQCRGTWSDSAVDAGVGGCTRGLPGLKRNQGPGSFETVTKDLRSTPTENIKGLSLDEATVCPYVTDVDKWTWTTNSAFLSSPGEVFIVGDLLLGPRGWDPVRVWEGVNSSALRCHSRTLQNEGQSTSRVFGFYQLLEKIPWGAFLHLSRVPVNTCPWGLHCEGEPSWEGWSQLWAAHRQVHWRAERHRVRGSMTLTHLPDWRPEGTWCKTRHDLPYPCPFSSTLIHSPAVPQGRRICPEASGELTLQFLQQSQPCSFSVTIAWTIDMTSSSLWSKNFT